MGSIKLDERALGIMHLFFNTTKVEVMDLLETEEVIVVVIRPGGLKIALQDNGKNVQKLRETLGKNVWILEYNLDPKRFVTNFFYRFKVKNVEIETVNNKFHIVVFVNPAEKGRAIGKDGKNLKLARELLNRHFHVESIQVQ